MTPFDSASCSSAPARFAQGRVVPTHSMRICDAQQLAKLANRHECFLDKVTYCLGVLSFGLFCYLLGSSPHVIPYLYCLFYILAVPLRWMYYRRKKWHYYLLDFCYYANAIFVSMILLFPMNSRLFMLCFSFSEGPLAWALIIWRCSLVFNSIDKIISVLIHLLPGTVFFILRWWDKNLLLADVVEDRPFHRWPVVNSIPTLWIWLFLAPLLVYCIWQGLYFLVVEGLRRQRILQDPEIMTSYKELKRKAEKANNIWWHLSSLLGDTNRVYMYAILQGVFTVATLALTVPMFRSYRLHICFEMFKLAATVWNGGRYVFEVVPRQTAKKLSNDKGIQTVEEKLSSRTKEHGSPIASMDGTTTEDARNDMIQNLDAQELVVCKLCQRASHGDEGFVQFDRRQMNSNADAIQLLQLILEKQNNQEKQNSRCDSLDQAGFEWNRQVACAS